MRENNKRKPEIELVKPKSAKDRLISWLNTKIKENPINNLTTDWNNPRTIGCLVNSFDPDLCSNWREWNENNALKHIEETLNIAKKHLGVTLVISPQEMANNKVNEETMISYLKQFKKCKVHPKYLSNKKKFKFSYFRENKDKKFEKSKPDSIDEENNNPIAIDFGINFSSISILIDDKVKIIPNKDGKEKIPSYLSFTQDGKYLIGDEAKNQLKTDPENTIYNITKIIGKRFDDESLQKDMKYFPFKIINKNNKPIIEIKIKNEIKQFQSEEIVGLFLKRLKEMAEEYLNRDVVDFVTTVPPMFNNAQRESIIIGTQIAGMNNTRIINEQTASSITYAFEATENKKRIMIFNCGGGSLSVSIFKCNEDGIEVLATSGDPNVGGEEFDFRVLKYFVDLYKKNKNKNIANNKIGLQKLRLAIEHAKKELSNKESATIHIDSLIDGEDFHEDLTRSQFEEINKDLFESVKRQIKTVLENLEMKPEDIDDIVITGGSTNIPKIKEMLKKIFGKDPSKMINNNKAAAFGACLEDRIIVDDICNLSLGIAASGKYMSTIIRKNTKIPRKVTESTYTTASDFQTSVRLLVYQGENLFVKDNYLLGEFDLQIVNIGLEGIPKFEVTFEINANGILEVTAKEVGTNNQKAIIIEKYNKKLNPEDIDKIIKENEKYFH